MWTLKLVTNAERCQHKEASLDKPTRTCTLAVPIRRACLDMALLRRGSVLR
jgi:hypothetical protein